MILPKLYNIVLAQLEAAFTTSGAVNILIKLFFIPSISFNKLLKSKSPNPLKLVKLYITPFNNGNV